MQGARAGGTGGDPPACTERRNNVEEGRGYRPARASAIPCAAPWGSAPKQPIGGSHSDQSKNRFAPFVKRGFTDYTTCASIVVFNRMRLDDGR
ncbi:Hypothetical protein GbCGDNIH7_8338 [Granulibacter bethesdensis]|nr:Hypothetical protein GbCGDNIH7_8338 [Granulibacter bethesdensis]